jgi:predicted permease
VLATLAVVLPVFGLILLGGLARWRDVLGPHAVSELNRFVVWLALPALLFSIMAHASLAALWQPGFVAAFGLGSLLLFCATVLLRRHSLADAGLDGLNAAYPNTGYMGFPLAAAALGPASLPLMTLATIVTVCFVFAAAIICIEVGQQTERDPWRLARRVGMALARNPLLVAPALGALASAGGLALPGSLERFLSLLGAAASPCALVALGAFLAQARAGRRPAWGAVALLTGLKLLALPVLVWLLAAPLFGLPPLQVQAAVLAAALPTGTGPFMLAEYYRRDAGVTSATILASTVLSVLTVAAYLAWAS